tara:strand:- start:187 stop:474 length:288 start_codon:yes stop_codon:yes gene_type:complete
MSEEYFKGIVLFKDSPHTSANICDKSLNDKEQIIQWNKEKEYDKKFFAQWPNGIPMNSERADQLVISGEISLPASVEDTNKIGCGLFSNPIFGRE